MMIITITINLHSRVQYVSQIHKIIDTKFAKLLRNIHISKMESNNRRLKNQRIEY